MADDSRPKPNKYTLIIKFKTNMDKDKTMPTLSKTAVMPRCSTCIFWKQTTFFKYEGVVNSGMCNEIKNKLEFFYHPKNIDGFVDFLEVDSDFGCTLHNES